MRSARLRERARTIRQLAIVVRMRALRNRIHTSAASVTVEFANRRILAVIMLGPDGMAIDAIPPLNQTALLKAIIESSDDAIISKNLDGIVTSWNGGAERMFGWTSAETLGRSIRLIIPPDHQDEEDTVL